MTTGARRPTVAMCLAGGMGCMLTFAVRADVTIEEQSTFDLGIIKAHGNSTELTTADKQRRDSTLKCEGFMSLLCRHAQSGEIVRLDRDLEWTLEPAKREYRETTFPTAAQRKAALEQAQAMLDKMKQCPVAPQSTAPGPDTAKCHMTAPQFDAHQTDQHAQLAGHDARLSQVTMTQSCTNPDTGDSCELLIAMDSWLTQDDIAGLNERRAFQKAYLNKLGLEDAQPLVQKSMRQFLAPYADSLKQLAGKAGDLKGYPLKSAVRIAFGGPRCAAAQKRAPAGGEGAAQSPAGSATGSGIPTSLNSVASNLGAKLVGGLFAKKKAQAPAPEPQASPLPPGMVQAAEFTVETVSISPAPIAPAEFEVPAGWKLIPPPPQSAPREFTCPKAD